ncbi:MAG TPA: hypothetical protein VI912_02150, partial [Candidatus Bilamarchaeaceae archaeon]|nr:hypothetical protein [Candidatus Bilamarchaeaceae archaeon]
MNFDKRYAIDKVDKTAMIITSNDVDQKSRETKMSLLPVSGSGVVIHSFGSDFGADFGCSFLISSSQ